MKLELKHLAPYLPYNLKMLHKMAGKVNGINYKPINLQSQLSCFSFFISITINGIFFGFNLELTKVVCLSYIYNCQWGNGNDFVWTSEWVRNRKRDRKKMCDNKKSKYGIKGIYWSIQ